jgi:hypothetical protein
MVHFLKISIHLFIFRISPERQKYTTSHIDFAYKYTHCITSVGYVGAISIKITNS